MGRSRPSRWSAFVLALQLRASEGGLALVALAAGVVLLGLAAYHPAGGKVAGAVGLVAVPVAMTAIGLRWTRGERGPLPRLAQATGVLAMLLSFAGAAATLSPDPLLRLHLAGATETGALPAGEPVDVLLRTRWPAEPWVQIQVGRGGSGRLLEGAVDGLPAYEDQASYDPAYAQWTRVVLPGEAPRIAFTLLDAEGFEHGVEVAVFPTVPWRGGLLAASLVVALLAAAVQGWATRLGKRSWLLVAVGVLLGLADGAVHTVAGGERLEVLVGVLARAVLLGGGGGLILTYLLARRLEPTAKRERYRPPSTV